MPAASSASSPGVSEVLATAVEALGGQRRDGQVAMAEAVAAAFDSHEHLVVQAGTGTGKSLAYLVPSLLHGKPVVIATATLALQHQLVEQDLPALVKAVSPVLGHTPSYAVLKGRSNFACLHRIREGVPDDQGALVEVPTGTLGAEVIKLREWAEKEAETGGTGDKDSAPRHTDRVWKQVSVSHRECMGNKCSYFTECFAEVARGKAADADVVVTNHSMLAIHAIEGVPMLPEHDVVVVDEAHELVARVTQATTDELSVGDVERAARRAVRHCHQADDTNPATELAESADVLKDVIATTDPGRLTRLSDELADALAMVRDRARATLSAFPKDKDGPTPDPSVVQAKGMVQDVFDVAARMAAVGERDVMWRTEGTERMPARLAIAPLDVAGPMRDRLLADRTVVFTSATLKLGGTFDPFSRSVGLGFGDLQPTTLDVGSPFDYPKQGILYVASLPSPGRDGLQQAHLDEIIALVDAADGGTLGLFSSRRAAETAAEAVRAALPHLTTLAQGDAQLPELAAQFAGDRHTNLFGTLSLWQGLDFPGDTCRLVLIDRIPFPRPDDPLMSARSEAADRSGGNGFMTVSATHAALLLAQGVGRLIRSHDDRGVVAILDSRVTTARYGSFLKASLPPLWPTNDAAVVRQALTRLAAPPE